MTWGKGVNVFSLLFSSHLNVCQKYNVTLNLIQGLYRFRLGGRNDRGKCTRKELIKKPSPAFVVFAGAQTQLLPLTKREGKRNRNELINLSTLSTYLL